MYLRLFLSWSFKFFLCFGTYYLIGKFDSVIGTLCFPFPLQSDAFYVRNWRFEAEPGKSYFELPMFCIPVTSKHMDCATLNVSTNPDELCLARSREIQLIEFELRTAAFLDVVNVIGMVYLFKERRSAHFTICLLQIGCTFMAFFVLFGVGLVTHFVYHDAGMPYASLPHFPFTSICVFILIMGALRFVDLVLTWRQVMQRSLAPGSAPPAVIAKYPESFRKLE